MTDPQLWASLLSLTAMEIVLGIDNLLFVAILAGRLPPAERASARLIGLGLALIARLALLASIAWLMGLTATLFSVGDHPVSWHDLVLVAGGLFLIYKGTTEIHHRLEGEGSEASRTHARASFVGILLQIVLLDVVFSIDSVVTAVGMAGELWIMATAMVLAMLVMLGASGPVSGFINRHPTVRMLGLSFLLLIGTTLVADGAGFHVPKGYIYVAMGFSIAVESLNQLAARQRGSAGPSRARARD
ncbi:hypothetical protein GCM10011611_50350 [Aliidongia dinghuensis]|uniref:TerC family protein n=1 Tax=Aliidongia dinghuensis TaxID=1867774 RepID=A0A8J2YXY2_9PROT|nr:TerC family protein [Aliidongia dinghuensis]GGF37883.1 hypothetical protein GCM10011611_50350 [Aliidongia dinghuensis]